VVVGVRLDGLPQFVREHPVGLHPERSGDCPFPILLLSM
jgi:hypothetical protein